MSKKATRGKSDPALMKALFKQEDNVVSVPRDVERSAPAVDSATRPVVLMRRPAATTQARVDGQPTATGGATGAASCATPAEAKVRYEAIRTSIMGPSAGAATPGGSVRIERVG
jgi:hypothetical protein